MYNTLENFFKVNRPVNRAGFFKYTICIALMQVVLSLLFVFFTEKVFGIQSILWSPIIFSFIVILPLLYLYWVQYSKRLWDVTGSNKLGISAGIVVFTISVICAVIFPVLTVAIYISFILFPGKIVRNEP